MRNAVVMNDSFWKWEQKAIDSEKEAIKRWLKRLSQNWRSYSKGLKTTGSILIELILYKLSDYDYRIESVL